ncbi:hypothetical protein HO539_08415 [Streptococcus suis]|nr:hypothetical protein [Streptococcus suis]NRG69496.1 hypothetical protein [Streptococcus suis]
MVYNKLLLSAGGGIVSTVQQADQADNVAQLFIGLGGTGVDCIRNLKTQVHARLKPDNPNSVVPTYEHLRFLGVDSATDTQGAGTISGQGTADEWLSLTNREFFGINTANGNAICEKEKALALRKEMEWFKGKKNMPIPDLSLPGAGGVRQVGRLLMMDQADSFVAKVKAEINAAMSGLNNPKIGIHIFSGISGGTGAGAFLDVCYLVRHVAREIGQQATIFGYFFLPDVNITKIPASDNRTQEYIQSNGYASMQELDYCMQIGKNGGAFTQYYKGGFSVKWDKAPVDMCHLISGTDANNNVIPDAYNYAMNITAEYVMDLITKANDAQGNVFDLKQQQSNFTQKVTLADSVKIAGTEMNYTVIGASCASVPMREINTYLASAVFQGFAKIQSNSPLQQDVNALVALAWSNGRGYDNLYDGLLELLTDSTLPESLDDYPYDHNYVATMGDKEMDDHYATQIANKRGTLVRNKNHLTSSHPILTGRAGNSNSLLSKIVKELDDPLNDINAGPIFVANLFNAATSYNIQNVISELKETNDQRLQYKLGQLGQRKSEFDGARVHFEETKHKLLVKLTLKKAYQAYNFYMKELHKAKFEIAVLQEMRELLDTLEMQVRELSKIHYQVLAQVMEELLETFRLNHTTLAAMQQWSKNHSFIMPLMTIQDLQPTLNAELNAVDIPNTLKDFVKALIGDREIWKDRDEHKIAKFVTDFFVDGVFSKYASRSIDSFLEDKYGTTNAAVLANNVYNNFIVPLEQKAEPLFPFDSAVWSRTGIAEIKSISIPITSTAIEAASKTLNQGGGGNDWTIKSSNLSDRIYLMRNACGLPLSAYFKLGQYQHAYFTQQSPGCHYFEGVNFKGEKIQEPAFSNWDKLPSLTPYSVLEDTTRHPKLQEILDESLGLYAEVQNYGLIDRTGNILTLDPSASQKIQGVFDSVRETVENANSPAQVAQLQAAIKELSDLQTPPLVASGMVLRTDGGHSQIESLRRDYFISSPAFHQPLRETINQLKGVGLEVEELTKQVEAKIEQLTVGVRQLKNFADALFTGVIDVEGNLVSYTQDEFGLQTVHTLSDFTMEFGSIPLYQAFLSYKEIDKDLVEQMTETARQRLQVLAPELQFAATKLDVFMSQNRVQGWFMLAAQYTQSNDIINFLIEINKLYLPHKQINNLQ